MNCECTFIRKSPWNFGSLKSAMKSICMDELEGGWGHRIHWFAPCSISGVLTGVERPLYEWER